MKRARLIWLLLPAILALVSVGLLAGLLREANARAAASNETIVVVADATAGMQGRLDSLAAGWPGNLLGQDGLARQYHLLAYRDAVQYQGTTGSEAEFQNLLNQLNAAGGGECPDAAFQALRAAGRAVPDSRAVLFGGSSPQGDRTNLAYIINKLVERGVRVYPTMSGWCVESPLTQEALFPLALLTGGFPFLHEAEEAETATKRVLNATALQDTLLIGGDEVVDISTFPLTVDSSATTLGVDEDKWSY